MKYPNTHVILLVMLCLSLVAISPASCGIPEAAINKIPGVSAAVDQMVRVDGNPATMHAHMKNGKLHITDTRHTRRYVKLNVAAMVENLAGFDGERLGLTHISDDGEITRWVEYVTTPDEDGFILLNLEFSETIISGFVGYSQWTATNQSGNWSTHFDSFDITQIDAEITHHGAWVAPDGNKTSKRVTLTVNPSAEPLTDFQILKNITYDTDMQSDFDDLRFGSGGENVSYWIEDKVDGSYANVWLKVPSITTTGGAQIAMYYGNASLSSTSRGEDVFIVFDDFSTDQLGTYWLGDSGDFSVSGGILTTSTASAAIYKTVDFSSLNNYSVYAKMKSDPVGGTYTYSTTGTGDTNTGLRSVGDSAWIMAHSSASATRVGVGYADNGADTSSFLSGPVADVYSNYMVTKLGSDYNYYHDDVLKQTYTPTLITPSYFILHCYSGLGFWDLVYLSKSTATVPTWAADGSEQTSSASDSYILRSNTTTDTATISNTTTLTITPGMTDFINVNTSSTDWSAVITAYNTVSTTKYSETSTGGYSNMSVLFTPVGGVTNGTINATYNTIVFTDHDYVGALTCIVDGVGHSATRTGQNVSVAVASLNNSEHTILFSIPYNPPVELLTPIDSATLSYTYPPLTHDVTFTWGQTTGHYKYEIYEGPAIKTAGTTTTNTSTLPLPAGYYTWLVYGYDDAFNEYSTVSDTYELNINTTISYTNETGVHGVIYDYVIGVETPLESSAVYIWNNTFSDSTITTSNGYYAFTGLSNGTYYLIAKKDRYFDSNTEIVTLLPENMTEHNIRMIENTGTDYSKHYVTFTVRSLWGTKYSDVTATAYLGSEAVGTPYSTKMTGTDGAVGFELAETTQYTITFVNAPYGIDETITLYPTRDSYNIYVYDTLLPDDEDIESEDIEVTITTEEIDDDDAYINVTYTDAMEETTSLRIYVNQSNEDDPINQTVIRYVDLGATSSTTHTFTVSDYTGQAYFINVIAEHTTFGDVFRTYSVRFEGMAEDWGFSRIWVYMGVAGMMFIGAIFKASKAEQGALIVCVAGWIFVVMGWFDSLGSAAVLSMKAGLGLATIIAIMANMAKKDRDETI